ncbi:MAG: hypothetical protein IPL41_13680 [Micropruina sp.]|nr:hypothetical protein [Micropruina sp.]
MVADPHWLDAHLGPLEVVAIVLPESPAEKAWGTLLAAVDAHLLRVLDLELIQVGESSVEVLQGQALADLLPPELVGAGSGMLAPADMQVFADELDADTVAAVLVVEHLTLLNVLSDFEAAGSEIILGGVLNEDELNEVLDETEA